MESAWGNYFAHYWHDTRIIAMISFFHLMMIVEALFRYFYIDITMHISLTRPWRDANIILSMFQIWSQKG